MELFGAKFSVTLGSWKLRFVLMLEDDDDVQQGPSVQRAPHHLTAQTPSGAKARRI